MNCISGVAKRVCIVFQIRRRASTFLKVYVRTQHFMIIIISIQEAARSEAVEANRPLSLNGPFPVIERPINCGGGPWIDMKS